MSTTMTPLRYPGGKSRLYLFIKQILQCNDLLGYTYIEPFAGGAGLAMKLLLNGDVKRIVINDLDPSIFAFWMAILNQPEEFCDLIASVDISVEEWKKQRIVYFAQDTTNVLQLGFSTFYLNRTNVSGVIKGGIIGGMNQTGSYLMDARFNKAGLIDKIQAIAKRKDQVHIYNLDAIDFLKSEHLGAYHKVFINFDPPYVKKGTKLYKNAFEENDHRKLAKRISECGRKWIVTYDICPLIAEIYSCFRYGYLDFTYSINSSKKAREYVFYSNNLVLPDETEMCTFKHEAEI
jgi:DNA adenine methylase